MGASDIPPSRESGTAEPASNAASSPVQTVLGSEDKKEKSSKYDVDRIGQRGIGKGANLYSFEKEHSLGQAMAAVIDSQSKFVTDPYVNSYISHLGQKIAHNSDAQVPFTFKVIDSPGLRTFALPGGFLYVEKGLILEVDSEAELAALMAHEIAHVAARHATRLATRRYTWNLISIPLTYVAGPAAIGTKQIGPLVLRKFNRDAEIEADLLGIEYQSAAGYDPQAFVEALEKLHSKERELRARLAARAKNGFFANLPFRHQLAEAFANYPPTEERILKLQTEISTLLPTRDDYVLDTSEFEEVRTQLAEADRPILRRHRDRDSVANRPVLHRHPSSESQ